MITIAQSACVLIELLSTWVGWGVGLLSTPLLYFSETKGSGVFLSLCCFSQQLFWGMYSTELAPGALTHLFVEFFCVSCQIQRDSTAMKLRTSSRAGYRFLTVVESTTSTKSPLKPQHPNSRGSFVPVLLSACYFLTCSTGTSDAESRSLFLRSRLLPPERVFVSKVGDLFPSFLVVRLFVSDGRFHRACFWRQDALYVCEDLSTSVY